MVMLFASVARAEDSVQDLITKLSDPSPKVRVVAARQLGYRAKEPSRFDPLEKAATSDPDPEVRLEALKGFAGYIDVDKGRAKALQLKLMKDPDPKVRYLAVAQQRPATPDTFAAHLALLKSDKDGQVRDIIMLSLHDSKAPGLVDAIIPMIDDKAVQRTVLSTLGYSKDAKAVPPLLDAVKRELPFSVSALAATGDPRAVDAMLAVLEKSTNKEMREDVFRSITSVPDGRFVPPLLAAWSKLSKADKKLSTAPEQYPGDGMDDVGHQISFALERIAETDQAPCEAAKTATGELKAYLKKVVPKKCGGVLLTSAIEEIVKAQIVAGTKPDALYTADATFSLAGATDEPLVGRDKIAALLGGAKKSSQPWITLSGDSKSAWVAMIVNVKGVEWRVTELAVDTGSGWRIAGGLASVGQDNKAVNAAAKANKLKLAALPDGKSDAAIAGAFTALTKGPFDATAAARTELLAYGSGPGERTTEGGVLARAWKAAWANKVTIEGPMIARAFGSTGFVIANVLLAKTGYKTPFRVMVTFDKAGAGWSVAQVHFATAAP
jgi:HEAT repeat protein